MSDTASVHDTTREYIQVTPSTEEFEFVNIKQLSSLHKLTTGDENGGGALSSLNPFSGGEHPVTVEFLALTTGDDGAVELYYGADSKLDVLQRRLESVYPHTFDIKRVGMNPRKRLVEPVEFSIEEFVNLLRDGRLQVDYDDLAVDAASALAEPDRPALESPDSDSGEEELADGGTTPNGATPMENLFGEEAAETVQQEAAIQSVYAQEPLDEESEDAEEPITRDEGRNRPLRALDDPSVIDLGDDYIIVAPPEDCPAGSQMADLDGPTATGEGTILARPALSETEPEGLRWHGQASRKKDWMTAMETAADAPTADQPRRNDERPNRSAVLTSIAETLHTAKVPTAFQVLFTRKPDWSVSASKRKSDLENNRDTFSQKLVRNFTGPIDRDDNSDLPTSISRRQDLIDAKTPKRTFTVNCRAIAVGSRRPPTQGTDGDGVDSQEHLETTQAVDGLEPALDPMAGAYYQLEPQRTADSDGLLGGSLAAENVLENLLERTLTTRDREKSTLGKVASSAKSRPDIVLNARELADLAVVPSAEEFQVDAFRATGATHEIDNPLPRPSQQTLEQFDHGMAVGLPLNDLGEPADEPVRIPPSVLQRHYARFAATGSGKSIGITNDLLSVHAATDGPSILVEPKGDGMCQDYLRCHYHRFGTLEDVYLFELPEVLPALSFFDIRPALAAGQNREDAIQDKVEHFHAVMEMLMGHKQYGNAYVAKEVISFLIKALFDPKHGSDAFTIDDLIDAAIQMQSERTVPMTAPGREYAEKILSQYAEKTEQDFQQTMDAVLNRLSKIKENTTVSQLFENVPEWDRRRGTYARESTAFSFAELLDEDVVVLFDLGPLRRRSQRAVTLLLLSDLWTSLQSAAQTSTGDRDTQTNLIIEEAAPIAASDLVTEQLLPQSRSFGLSLGFVMQFPSQVEMENTRAYKEILNNVQTSLYSTLTKQDDVGEILAAGEYTADEMAEKLRTIPRGHWIADLPSPAFDESPPRPFSVKALPIPPGHPDGDDPLQGRHREQFEQIHLDDCRREARRFGLESGDYDGGSSTTDREGTVDRRDRTSGDRPTQEDASPSTESHPVRDIDALLDGDETDDSDDGDPTAVGGPETETQSGTSDGPSEESSPSVDTDTDSSKTTESDDATATDEEPPASSEDGDTDGGEDGRFDSVDDVIAEARAIKADHDADGSDETREQLKRLGELCDEAQAQGLDITYTRLLRGIFEADDADSTDDGETSSDSDETDTSETVGSDSPDQATDLDGLSPTETLPEDYSNTTDAELAEMDLTRDDEQFLSLVLSAMNRELEDYSLLDSMTDLRNRAGDPDVDTLAERGFIDIHTVSRRRYYSVLPPGREFLNRTLKRGQDVGDLGEKTPHKVGVELLRRWFEQQPEVDRTTTYQQLSDDAVIDVLGFDAEGTLRHVGEVETNSNDRKSVVADFEKLDETDARTWWVVPSSEVARDVLRALMNAGHCPDLVDSDLHSIGEMQSAIDELDLAGMEELRTYRQLNREVER